MSASSLLDLFESGGGAEKKGTYVEVVLPLPLAKLYTYSVPFHLKEWLQKGVRVEVQLGRQGRYAGLVYAITEEKPAYQTRPIISVLDDFPVVTEEQFRLWEWMSTYYLCSMGELMAAALPAGLKLAGESKLLLAENYESKPWMQLHQELPGDEALVIEQLQKKGELSLSDIQRMLKLKSVHKLVKSLLDKQLVQLKEELQERYKPKMEDWVALAPPYELNNPSSIKEAFDVIGSRAHKQIDTLMAFMQLGREQKEVRKKELYERAKIDSALLNKLVDKGIFSIYQKELSRLDDYDGEAEGNYALSEQQQQAYESCLQHFADKKPVLLHGVTGSGKTQVFVELMEHYIGQGQQVLYLLPEIALTAQIVGRLQKHFGDQILVYHSKFNNNERVEIWRAVQEGVPIILGARSALLLPFQSLGLILVDEEHDPSYKQQDPAPRYNARDTAVFMAHLHGANILLGSATPSLESYQNALEEKYALVQLNQRFGGLALPKIEIVDLGEQQREKRMHGIFSGHLLDALKETLANGEQAILFQNRRGYAPLYRCKSCGWTTECKDCDVSLTYHKYSNNLRCHYCGYQRSLPKSCDACGSHELEIIGFGTEKIEDELQIFLPDARLERMDWDTVRGKNGHDRLINRFADGQIDVLIGTQMVTKGLDFDNVGLVAVLSADQMLQFPDFRANERAFQLMTQVAGRAGRKKKQGRVLIQAYQAEHEILREVLQHNFQQFQQRELAERRSFKYPPFQRLIKIQFKHKKRDQLLMAAEWGAKFLQSRLGDRVLGPAEPSISRVRTYYLMDLLIKLGRGGKSLRAAKDKIRDMQELLRQKDGLSGLRVVIDVDPY
ncbi:replication restart helicase PriA [Saprospira grandis]|uniref:replication restart helicase PriA n=1 Tax=Saprospira grandis TaxID=1008 RepID=UPI0022DE810B|nr:primosomal protein N' [Saprospira grandis]WBM75160.1 primosomal protein N' [Saprospira grandis]